ncbi:MAG: hypothetical protein ACKVZ0_00590 [Gemmatimonadales bacterium]
MIALATALWQLGTVTVGDTVWLTTSVTVPNGHVLRPQVWDLGEIGQALAPPEVDYRAGVATVRYPVVFWFPGDHRLTMPGAIVVSSAGKSDTLPGAVQLVRVSSVLPADQPKGSLAPRPAADLVAQASRSWFPLLVALIGLLAALAGALAFRRRRLARGVQAGSAPPPPEPAIEPILTAWLHAGEIRTSLDGWAHLITDESVRRSPVAQAAAAPIVAALTEASFRRDGSPGEIAGLVAAARDWWQEGR